MGNVIYDVSNLFNTLLQAILRQSHLALSTVVYSREIVRCTPPACNMAFRVLAEYL